MAASGQNIEIGIYMIEQEEFRSLPDEDAEGEIAYQIFDALPPDWSEVERDFREEALEDVVKGRFGGHCTPAHGHAVAAIYHAWGQWPEAGPFHQIAADKLITAKEAFARHGVIYLAKLLDWSRGTPLLPVAFEGFPRFSYLTSEEIASAVPIPAPLAWSDDHLVVALCSSLLSIVNEASQKQGYGLYCVFNVRQAA